MKILKHFSLYAMIIFFILINFPLSCLPFKKISLKLRMHITSFFCRLSLKILSIHVTWKGLSKKTLYTKGLLVSNHVSYIDILVLSALRPSLFITSTDVEGMPLQGLLSRLAGSHFINRKTSKSLKQSLDKVTALLKQDFPITFFPEATSTDGSTIKPFKSALFECAVRSGLPVIPVCLRYTRINDEFLSLENRDKVYYYDDMNFLPHLNVLLSCSRVNLEGFILEAIPSADFSRTVISSRSYESICSCYSCTPYSQTQKTGDKETDYSQSESLTTL